MFCSSTSLGWVPLWGEYPEEVVEDYQEAYGLLYEDLELLSSAFREDNLNCKYRGLLEDIIFFIIYKNMIEIRKATAEIKSGI